MKLRHNGTLLQNTQRAQYFNRLKSMGDDRWPKLLFNAIFAIQDTLKWSWLRNIRDILAECNMDNSYNVDSEIIPRWVNIFRSNNKAIDYDNWYDNAHGKSTLRNYIKHKTQPSLEPYLLDKLNFAGCNLKFKARSNVLNLEGRKVAWSNEYNGLCKLCNNDKQETIEHFMFECTKLAIIRDTSFNMLKNNLLKKGWDNMWQLFINGNIDIKRHLMLDNIFQDNNEVGRILDQGCKQFVLCAWKARTELYNNITD